MSVNTEVKSLSFVERTDSCLLKPMRLAEARLSLAYYHTTGKKAFNYGYAASGLFLVQTITSLVAIPFQVIAGIFAFVHHIAQNEIRKGFHELKLGFETSRCHVLVALISIVTSVGTAVIVTFCLPHCIVTWNKHSCWWEM